MKYFVSAAVAALMAAAAGSAQAEGFYAQANFGGLLEGKSEITADMSGLGSGTLDAETKGGVMGSALVGWTVKDGFALEAELLRSVGDVDTKELDAVLGEELNANLTTTLVMANAKYTFLPDSAWQPYLAGGLGFGQSKYKVMGESEEDQGVAWQAKVGVIYKQSDKLSWDFGYRFVSTPDFTLEDGADSLTAETDFHAVSVGLRYDF